MSRVLNVIGYITAIISAAQVGGLVDLMPAGVAAVLIATGATLSAFTDRIQGSKSTSN